MSGAEDPRERLDVEMLELSGSRPFVPDRRASRLQAHEPIQADADQHGGDGRTRDCSRVAIVQAVCRS